MSIREFFEPLNAKFNINVLIAIIIGNLAIFYAPFASSFIAAMVVLVLWYAIVVVAFCAIEHLTNKNKYNE